jgi:hypothetical protein
MSNTSSLLRGVSEAKDMTKGFGLWSWYQRLISSFLRALHSASKSMLLLFLLLLPPPKHELDQGFGPHPELILA